MIRRTIPFLAVIVCWWNGSNSNPLPLDPYAQIAITEVNRTSEVEWSIELDGEYCLFDSSLTAYPCSAAVFFKVEPSAAITTAPSFRVKAAFNRNRIGVIAQAIGKWLVPNHPFMLADTSVIFISRDSAMASAQPPKYWSFPLRHTQTGNSLVALLSELGKIVVYETSRVSIGSIKQLLTRYKLKFIDKYGKALQYIMPWAPAGDGVFYYAPDQGRTRAVESDSVGTTNLSISITESKKSIVFADLLSGHSDRLNSYTILPGLDATYNDRDSAISDTIRFPTTYYRIKVLDNSKQPVSTMDVYWHVIGIYYEISENLYQRLGTSGIWDLRVYQAETTATYCFNQSRCYPETYGCMNGWTGKYIDTPKVILDTIIITPTQTTAPNSAKTNPAVRFTTLPGKNRDFNFIASSPVAVGGASIAVYTALGEKIGEMNFRMDGPGTHTVVWNSKTNGRNDLPPGTYICRLSLNGNFAASNRVTVR